MLVVSGYLAPVLLLMVCLPAAALSRVNGSTTTARCPVTGALLQLDAPEPAFAVVEFVGGQRLFVKDEQAADKYRETPRAYWLSPFQLPPPGDDGKRGLPDMQGRNVSCAVTPEDWLIVNTMNSARVMHVGGQCVYFCCQACATTFWRQPGKSIIGASPDASSVGDGNNNHNREPELDNTGAGYGATFVMISILVTSVLSVVAFAALTKMWKNSVPVSAPTLGGRRSNRGGGESTGIRRKNKGFDRLEAQPGEVESDEFGGTYCDDDDDTDTI